MTGRDWADLITLAMVLVVVLVAIFGPREIDPPRPEPVTVTVSEDPQGGIVCHPTGVCRVEGR